MIAERPITLDVGAGICLDARVASPPGARAGVVVCHPHPLYGGDMDNPIVLAVRDAAAGQGLATLRFDFRGVGTSTGQHDDGRGEQDDVRAALGELRRQLGAQAPVALAGYSFGAAVAAAVARKTEVAALALVAPPLRLIDVEPPAAVRGALLVVVGAEDQYCPAGALEALRDAVPAAMVTVIEGTDHFFFGSLDALADAIAGWAGTVAR